MKTTILLSVFLFCSALVAYGQWSNTTNLSGPKWQMGETTLGTKAYFAGGHNGSITLSTVETYDVKTGLWDIIGNLNTARRLITGVSCGSKVFFAGGVSSDMSIAYSTVDIYDTITRQWSVKQLSIPRIDVAAVSKGNKVLFAGGCLFDFTGYKVVDIYNTQTDSWSTANLSIARGGMAYVVVGDLAIFAGGILPGGALSNQVDIYNFVTDTWSTATLSQARCWASATVLGNKVLIAGGMKSFPDVPTDRVDIYDASNGTWSTANLFSARAWISSGTVNGKAYFAGGSNIGNGGITYDYSDVIDIYDGNTWSLDFLAQPRCSAGLVLGDKFLIAGGKNNTGVLSSVAIFTDPTLIRVPVDYPKIQLAIDAASKGDTVLVAENTYYENINFKGKAILVGSEFIMDKDTSHISKTIINGSQPENPDIGSVVTFESGEDTTSVLSGFTITGGTGTKEIIESADWRIGGGISILASGAKLLYNYIDGNSVSNTGGVMGGGIVSGGEVTNMPWIVLRNNKVMNNKALSSGDAGNFGGIIICYNLIMTDNEISHNEANGSLQSIGGGAAIYGNFGPIKVDIRNNLITENKAVSVSNISTNTVGGGLVILKCSGIVAENTISHNIIESSAGKWGEGAGVLVQEVIANDFVFENNLIDNNSYVGEKSSGGGMELFNCGGKFRNNIIHDNQATVGGGITLNNYFGEPTLLINNTITGNKATTSGGGLHLADGKAVVINTIIWGNTATSAASISQSGSTLSVKYSDVQGSTLWPGVGNINEDPMFTDSIKNPFALSEGSPCIDKGVSDTPGLDMDTIDIIGNQRIWGARVDMGAYEFGSFPSGIDELVDAGKTVSFKSYPNPFTNSTTFTFILEKSANVNIRVFDIFGRLVAEPVNEFHQIGEQNIPWNAEGLPSGLYFCRLKVGNQFVTHKIVKK